MQIVLNGESYAAPEPCSILGLLVSLALDPSRVAVELDGQIVKKARWDETPLHAGARVEIVQFVGGG